MKQRKTTYNLINQLAAILMVITLLWLTISTPFVNAARQQAETFSQAHADDENGPDSDDSPFGNTTEEKTESKGGITITEEFLHDMEEMSSLVNPSLNHICNHNFELYVAFHGELLCPPPNSILS
jgi:flagellar biosynthesis/type III secretory pathway M-ring protein FliF/YscJ